MEDENGAVDPHIWFDIELWQEALDYAVTELKEYAPEHAEYFDANKEEYFKKTNQLKNEAEKLQKIPEDKRILITAHDAFGYFGNANNLEVIGLQGLSTDAEIGITDINEISILLSSSNTLWVLFSTMILGVAAGIIGCLAYWKRQNLMSDSLSHAALPGVIIAFLLVGEKNLLILVIGAGISALFGAFLINWITSESRISEDTAMGMILAVFYGFGIMLLTIANRSAGGNQSGLDNFIYGQAASMVKSDVLTMSILACLVIGVVFGGFKEWKIYLFDLQFAKGIGLSIKGMNTLYILVLVTTIVIGIQAVGVILMAAILIIPAVSARYWTRSFLEMTLISAVFGGISGAVGTLISALGQGWPTGPFISMNVQHDASMGIVFTTLFAIGVILISTTVGNVHLDVQHALMGEITFIPFHSIILPVVGGIPQATALLLFVLIIVVISVTLFYKEWKITTFDPALAASLGIPVLLMHYIFMGLVSITTVASFDAVGAILVVAMLITPAASAYLWTNKLFIMLILSGAFGVISAVSGYFVAVWLDTSISGSMALATGIVFMISFIFSPNHGQISKRIRPSNTQ